MTSGIGPTSRFKWPGALSRRSQRPQQTAPHDTGPEPTNRRPEGLPTRRPGPETPDSFQRLRLAVLPLASSQAREPSREDVSDPPPRPSRPSSSTWRNVRARASQLFDTKKVLGEPAVRFPGPWATQAAREICERMVESQIAHGPDAVSKVDLAECVALEYERKHPELPATRRLLPPGATKTDYYNAEARAVLRSVGETDPDAVIKSFKKAGVGGLHRHHVVTSSAAGNAIGVAQTLVPEPTTKAVLASLRVALQMATNAFTVESGGRRARNANTEEVMPLGKADAPPRLKNSPDMLSAPWRVIRELRGAEKNLRRMETMAEALDNARTPEAARQAREALELANAKYCYLKHKVKDPYKAAAEAAAIEFRGNERNLYVSYVGGTLGYTAGVLAILTPVVVSAPVTGGFSAAAAASTLALYGIYQLSNGPSKDGEAKAMRALVALAKATDFLVGDRAKSDEQRAQAYETYLKQRKAAPWTLPAKRAEIKARARADLLNTLGEISKGDQPGPMYGRRENWEAVTAYKAAQAEVAQRLSGSPAEAVSAAQAVLKEEFETAHAADFDTQAAASAWKVPMGMRFDGARRLVAGKAAQAHKALLRFEDEAAKGKLRRPGWQQAHARRRAELEGALKDRLLDMFNLELALQRMKPLISAGKSDDAEAIGHVAEALGAVRDADVHALFCADARGQTDALNRAKKLGAFGELQRYTYTNLGANLLVMASNQAVLGASMGLAIDKAVLAGEGIKVPPRFADERDAVLTSQTGATAAAPLNAGGRAGFKAKELNPILDVIARKNGRIDVAAMLPVGERASLDPADPAVRTALDEMVAQMRGIEGVPDSVALAMQARPAEGEATAHPNTLKVDLQPTTPYQKRQYEKASLGQKLRFHKGQAATVVKHAGMSLLGPPVTLGAQWNLKRTRGPLNESEALGPKVRGLLSRDDAEHLAQHPPPASQGPRVQPPPKKPNPFREALGKVAQLASSSKQEQAMAKLRTMSNGELDMLLTRPKLKPGVREMIEALKAQRRARTSEANPFVLPPLEANLSGAALDAEAIERSAMQRIEAAEAAAQTDLSAEPAPRRPPHRA